MTTMNTDERERLKQIRERRDRAAKLTWMDHPPQPTWKDIDFLLSLVDGQVESSADFECYWDEYQYPYLPDGVAVYEHAKRAWNAAATRMRERCVARAKELRREWAGNEVWVDAADEIIEALESLTLDGEKEQ